LLRMVVSVCTCWVHNVFTLPLWLVSTDFGTCPYQCCQILVHAHTSVVKFWYMPIPVLSNFGTCPYQCCQILVHAHISVKFWYMPIPVLSNFGACPYKCCQILVHAHTSVVKFCYMPI
jgi:hypothetical protein